MTCFFWNVRGFNKILKYFVVIDWINNKEMKFGCILEIRVKERKVVKILSFIFRDWFLIVNYEDS